MLIFSLIVASVREFPCLRSFIHPCRRTVIFIHPPRNHKFFPGKSVYEILINFASRKAMMIRGLLRFDVFFGCAAKGDEEIIDFHLSAFMKLIAFLCLFLFHYLFKSKPLCLHFELSICFRRKLNISNPKDHDFTIYYSALVKLL